MPELPEVETIIRDLKRKVLKRTFLDVWTDNKKMIKKPRSFEEFKDKIRGKKIQKIWRRGKNIIFDLSDDYFLLVHQKLTGHLLFGNWKATLRGVSRFTRSKENGYWKPKNKGPLEEKVNTFIHLMFWLDNGQMLALSDLRKFTKVELLNPEELRKELNELGPEPLGKDFTFEKFKEVLKRKNRGKIKQILMDQNVIVGIGNIYSDEILWQAKINPLKDVSKLNNEELKKTYEAMKEILEKAVKMRGTSISDFRDTEGKPGFYEKERKVYQREGEKCPRCKTIIKRVKIGGRSAHFCPSCQN